ncbi:MAG: L,D-transpeptidase [Bacteroidota bacterium]|nr:L,D-transpeptidase [Bacteroidota bacterium]
MQQAFRKMTNRTPILLSTFLFALVFLSFVPANKINIDVPAKEIARKSLRKNYIDNPYYIVISKKDYELKVYDQEGWYATYPCVFGSNDVRDKYMEGDKRTPEGKFKVLLKKIHPKWGFELLLDYPNEQSIEKFKERIAKGLIPRNAKIGSGIAIHATRPQEEWTVDYFQNWTDGCISLKYTEAKDLYSYIPVGTPVTITE